MANYLFGFSQADTVTGLIIEVFLIREGLEWLREASEVEENGRK
jgi:divalent metal cation (Fe/Co/Zn/Cd) transporter